MDCGKCRKELASLNEIIFFVKGEKDVFLALAPESKEVVKSRSLDVVETKKFPKVYCKFCQHEVGTEVPFGPNSYELVAFGCEKVCVAGTLLNKSSRWWKMVHTETYLAVCKRTPADFFQEGGAEDNKKKEITFSCPELPPIVFPSEENPEDFRWDDLDLPYPQLREYQVECYLEALQKDFVAVLPTGAGKTLIASMVLKKMRLLNTSRMGLFIVDKIPLVYQQQKAIQRDTGLRVIALCGESTTLKTIQSLYDDSYDVVVATAGALDYRINNNMMFLEAFSVVVFDEAHHCEGKHVYMDVLKKLFLLPSASRPRILGLTASPFPARNLFEAQNNLRRFCDTFKTDAIYYPPPEKRTQQPPEYITFRYTARQDQFKHRILQAHNQVARSIRERAEEMAEQLTEDMVKPCLSLDISQIKGQINFMLERLDMVGEDSRQLSCQLRLLELLVDSVDLAETIGIGVAAARIRDVVFGRGDGGKMKNELEASGFPLGDYVDVDKVSILANNDKDAPAQKKRKEEDQKNVEEEMEVELEEEDRDLSPRLMNLNDQLHKYLATKRQTIGDETKKAATTTTRSRILVFARTRSAVYALRSHIQRHFPELNPNFAVGHGGQGGQSWGGGDSDYGQAAIIRDFHDGVCQLLVCTTVLEEGIDVSDCDLVIRYSGVNTLIQFIQSRGRARREGSRYVIIVTLDEHEEAIKLASQERIMEHVLTEHAALTHLPAPFTKNLIAAAQGGGETFETFRRPGAASGRQDSLQLIEAQSDAAVVVEFYLEDYQKLDLDRVYDDIKDVVSPYGLTVDRIIVRERQAWDNIHCSLVERGKDHLVLCRLTADDTSATPTNITAMDQYQKLTNLWNFQISAQNRPVFTKIAIRGNSGNSKAQLRPRLDWKVETVSAGELFDKRTFIQRYSMITHPEMKEGGDLHFSSTGQLASLIFMAANPEAEEGRSKYKLSTSLLLSTGVLGFGLTSWQDGCCSLYIPLLSVPLLQEIEDAKWKRVTKHPLLSSLARFPVLCLRIRLGERLDYMSLRQTLSNSSVVALPLFDARINPRVEELEAPQLSCPIPIPPTFPAKRALLEDEWEVLIKSSDLRIHASVPDLNNWTSKIRQSYLEAHQQEDRPNLGPTFATAVRLCTRRDAAYWRGFDQLVTETLRSVQDKVGFREEDIEYTKPAVANNQVRVLRTVSTPTREVFPPSVPITTSRLTRMLADQHSIIVVAFRDENLDKIQNVDEVLAGVEDTIANGIEIMGRRVHFLCASASQIRDHKAFFVDVNSREEAEALRRRIIADTSRFDNVSKYLSRLGLFCTSDTPSNLQLTLADFEEIPDLKAKDGDLVTDGAGYIRKSLAEQLFKNMQEAKPVPSAFQFRCRGLKGVLVVLPDDYPVFKGCKGRILFRESQEKFKSNHLVMGIVKEAKVHRVTLNRESINLLESLYLSRKGKEKWNLPNILVEKQEAFLEEAALFLEESTEAVRELSKHLEPKELELVKGSFDLVTEPHYFRLLRCCHRIGVSDLCKRANLPVKQGCLVMGIPDYSGCLATDQVFLLIPAEDGMDGSGKVILGPVIIYRNPCLHPGDVRLVEAVDIPELHLTPSVLVLPAENSDYSLAASCSGGDLDGDQFSVIWDPDLVPPKHLCQKPCNYRELPGSEPETVDDVTEPSEMAAFFTKCFRNDALGRVANMHLALCDNLERGAMEPLAQRLALSQAVAVDFPKTGKVPEVPKDALELVKSKGYPDFMEKKGTGETYISKKVLGELYRGCKSYLFNFDMEEEENRKIPLDKSLEVSDYEECVEEAVKAYEHYVMDMRQLMTQFSLKCEEEVVLGRAVAWHPLLNGDRDKVSRDLKEAYQALKRKYEGVFTRAATQHNIDQLAYAWYHVAYSQNRPHHSRPFLSFPWVIATWLVRIKNRSRVPQSLPDTMVHLEVGESALQEVVEYLDHLKEVLPAKDSVFNIVKDAIGKQSEQQLFNIRPYGSTSVLLCEAESDIDICIKIRPAALTPQLGSLNPVQLARHYLETVVAPAANTVFRELSACLNKEVPVIKGVVDQESGETRVDLSCNEVGLAKTRHLLGLFCLDPANFVAFSVLVQWARYAGLIKHLNSDDHVFETAVLYAFIVHLLFPDLKQQRYESNGELDELSDLSLAQLTARISDKVSQASKDTDGNALKIRVGRLVNNFFRHGHSLARQDLELVWPVEGVPVVPVKEKDAAKFRKACSQSLHALLATRNMRATIKNAEDCCSTQTTYTKKLSLSLSSAMGRAKDFHERELSFKTNAIVTIAEEEGEDRLVLRAAGSRRALSDLRVELTALANNSRAFTLGMPTRKTSKYFMVGSTFMMARNSSKFNVKLSFGDSRGGYHALHHSHQRSTPIIKFSHPVPTAEWVKDIAVPVFTEKLTKQLVSLPTERDKFLNTLEVTARFGSFYTVDIEDSLPPTQRTLPLEDFLAACEQGRSMRKSAEKSEFKDVKRPSSSHKKEFHTVPLSKGGGRRNMDGDTKPVLRRERKKRTIGMSFRPGIANPVVELTENRQQAQAAATIYEKVLTGLGFVPGSLPMKRLNEEDHWNFNISCSTGHELSLVLDKDFKFQSLRERNLSYSHTTFFHGKDLPPSKELLVPENDIRFHVQTHNPIVESHPLFKTIFVDGDTENLPLELNNNSAPVLKDGISQELRRNIHLGKRNKDIKYFKKDGVMASIIKGQYFMGSFLSERKDFCDISLYYPPQDLLEANRSSEQLAEFCEKVLRTSCEVSEELSRQVQDFNKERANNRIED